MQDTKQLEFESTLMNFLLNGDEPVLSLLRIQYANASVKSRTFTGVGFYTDYLINPSLMLVTPNNFEVTDVIGVTGNDKTALGFILFIRKGNLAQLEGYTYGTTEVWPNDYSGVVLKYIEGNKPSEKRDFNALRAKLSN